MGFGSLKWWQGEGEEEEMSGFMKRNKDAIAGRRFYKVTQTFEKFKITVVQIYYDDFSLRLVIGDVNPRYMEGTYETRATLWMQDHFSGDEVKIIREAFHSEHYDRLCATIALAITEWATIFNSKNSQWSNHPEPFHKMLSSKATDPVSGHRSTISHIIQKLNDSNGWTREQIADWLDTLDEQPTYYPTFDEATTGVRSSATLASLEQSVSQEKS